MNALKDKRPDWKPKLRLLSARLLWYFLWVLIFVLICCCLLNQLSHFQTEADSARYVLSALVQSQAAIIAIVLILTQVAIQLTSSYSKRAKFDLFRNNQPIKILLLLYGISIFYGLIVLRLVKDKGGTAMCQSVSWSFGHHSISFKGVTWTFGQITLQLEWLVSIALVLGILTFIALFCYMGSFFDSLKPENYIKKKLNAVTKDTILNCIKADKIGIIGDPLQPIVDIIYSSISIHDLEITITGLQGIVDRAIEIISPPGMDEKEILLRYFCNHLQEVGTFAAGISDEKSTVEVIENLEHLWNELW